MGVGGRRTTRPLTGRDERRCDTRGVQKKQRVIISDRNREQGEGEWVRRASPNRRAPLAIELRVDARSWRAAPIEASAAVQHMKAERGRRALPALVHEA